MGLGLPSSPMSNHRLLFAKLSASKFKKYFFFLFILNASYNTILQFSFPRNCFFFLSTAACFKVDDDDAVIGVGVEPLTSGFFT